MVDQSLFLVAFPQTEGEVLHWWQVADGRVVSRGCDIDPLYSAGLGGQIDNAKHLRGACDNLRINMVDNASIDLLTAFSLLALELKEQDTIESAKDKPLVQQAISLYRTGFRRMLRIDTWEEVKSLIILFNVKVLDFNSEIKPLMDTLTSELMVNRTSYKLKELLDKIS